MSDHTNDGRGQVGVGTLIVFIAMVLVAAIASGVLVNAVGLLQTQSSQASEESSEQVSNRMQIVNSVGSDIDGTNETVGAINLTVSLSPSADEVDLSQATVQWLGPTGMYSLTHDTTADGDGNFTVAEVNDEDDSLPVLNSRDDRFSMNFDVDSFATSDLSAGDTVQLRITTRAGATTILEIVVPESVAGEISVRV